MAYPYVKILDSTQYICKGTVSYMSAFCSNDQYVVTPQTTWEANSRGTCLVTEISATCKTPSGDIAATPYSSSGTSYSNFAILDLGNNAFEVTRRTELNDVTGAYVAGESADISEGGSQL